MEHSGQAPGGEVKTVFGVTAAKITKILAMKDESRQRALLANLRNGAGKKPGDMPELWGEIFSDIPETMYSYGGEPSREEWAIYTALTLFATHQQGKSPKTNPMHAAGRKLGVSLSDLVETESDRPRVARRFSAMATSGSMKELNAHLRGLVQILRAKDIPVDYAALASDLYYFQNPTTAPQIRLRWGQDFYRKHKAHDEEE